MQEMDVDDPEDAELAELEEQLRKAAERLDPVPPQVVQAAIDSLTWRTIDADLAELAFDSLAHIEGQALVRGPEDVRMLTFEAAGLTIDIRVARTGRSRRFTGQLVPPQHAALEIRHPGGLATLDADDLGRFSSGPLAAGPVSLRCSIGAGPDRRRVITDWVSI
jgi:hypothetical protein